jgi:hypothetical protein
MPKATENLIAFPQESSRSWEGTAEDRLFVRFQTFSRDRLPEVRKRYQGTSSRVGFTPPGR